MAKYHLNGNGEPGKCFALEGNCPFGDVVTDHYSSPESARLAYEEKMNNEIIAKLQKRNEFLQKTRIKEEMGIQASYVEEDERILQSREYGDLLQKLNNYGEQIIVGDITFEKNEDWDSPLKWRGKLPEPNFSEASIDVFNGYYNGSSCSRIVLRRPEYENVDLYTIYKHELDGEVLAELMLKGNSRLKKDHGDLIPSHVDMMNYEQKLSDIQTGTVNVQGFELHNTGSFAPVVWETSLDSPIAKVREIYMRQRHGIARLTVVPEEGMTKNILVENSELNSYEEMARFFVKADKAFKDEYPQIFAD